MARRIPALLLTALLLAACRDDSNSGNEGDFAVATAHPVTKPDVQTLRAPSGTPPRYFESESMNLNPKGSADLALQCPDGMTAFDGYLAQAGPGVVMGYNGPRPHEPGIWQFGLTNLRDQPAEYSTGIVCAHEG